MHEQLKPVAEVSEETFSSDGTSDIITCNLPIGTKLYAIPADQMLVPRELLERVCSRAVVGSGIEGARAWLDDQYAAMEELRELLCSDKEAN